MSELEPSGGGSSTSFEPQERTGKPVSFYLAIFLGLLLLVSGGLNLLLLVVSVFGSATAGLAGIADDSSALYDVVAVGGDPEADQRVLRIHVEGAIAEASSPLLGAEGGTISQVERALKLAKRDDDIRGVLLDINSPGGGVTDSDRIWMLLRDFREETDKPILALFGDTAASGGYYIAAAADRILARPTTITGSIGVILSNLNFAEAAREFGIRQEVVVSDRTPYKDIMSPFRPMTDEERAILKSIVDEMYDRFVDVVDRGRPKLSRDEVVALADGRIYSARQAAENGLVDGIATREEALAQLAEMCGAESVRLVEQRRRPTFADLLFQSRAEPPSLDAGLAQLLGRSTGPRLLYWWSGGR